MKAILITITLFVFMAFGMGGYVIGVSQCTDKEINLSVAGTRAYQFDLEESGTTIYQDGRFVGYLPFDSTQSLDSLMIEDNR